MYNTLEGEIWKDVVGYEGLYQVSNYGRINRSPQNYRKWNDYLTKMQKLIMKGQINHLGYIVISLTKDKIIKRYLVHRLVAIAFIPNPENKPQVNHKDMNRSNNHIENLEWATARENVIHGIENNKNRIVHRGMDNKRSKFIDIDILQIRHLLESGMTHKAIAELYNTSKGHISLIRNRKIWKHI